jgi:membrane protease YdiL (CAAX protease family)
MSILVPAFPLASSPILLPNAAGLLMATRSLLASATTQPTSNDAITGAQGVGLIAALFVGFLLAFSTGVFRPGRVDGPLRVPIGRPLWPLAIAIGIGVVVWIGSEVFYGAVKQTIQLQQRASGSPTSMPTAAAKPTIVDFAVLSTVPGLLAFAWLFYADRQLVRLSQLQLGFTRGRFLDGVAKGLLASVMILPAMFVASILTEAMYVKFNYTHPGEHELLRLMHEAKYPFLRGCLIAGAVITAPFFEEYLFRGFLQTFLRQTIINWWLRLDPARLASPAGLDAATGTLPVELPPSGAPPIMLLSYRDAAPAVSPPRGKRIWQTWLAILITSALFASVHEAWTAPLIFLLAIFLGYAYERTGSLWTTITIHLMFNATSTVIFLSQQGS